MAQQWFLIKVPPRQRSDGFVEGYRFVHGVLPILWQLRCDMGQQPRRCINHRIARLLTSDEEFETGKRRQVTTGEYFFSSQRDFD